MDTGRTSPPGDLQGFFHHHPGTSKGSSGAGMGLGSPCWGLEASEQEKLVVVVGDNITGEDPVVWQRHRGCDVGSCCGNLVKASEVQLRQLEDFL